MLEAMDKIESAANRTSKSATRSRSSEANKLYEAPPVGRRCLPIGCALELTRA